MMLPRERVEAALAFRAPDVPPLRIYAAPGGLLEHGRKLAELMEASGHDFGDMSRVDVPDAPPAEDYDADGRYHAFRTDAWGVRWEFRIFGVWGHPVERPLDDLAALDAYQPPALPAISGPDVDAGRAAVAEAKKRYFMLGGGGSIFETLHSVRRFEDVLMDIAEDRPEINRIADMLTEHALASVERSLATDVDCVAFGDDYGTATGPIVSPRAWRRFFKPRYEALFAPIRRAGKSILFHSCGRIEAFLPDLAELGVSAVWPQLPLYDAGELAARCRDLGLTLELHPDRGDLMQHGTPEQVRRYMLELAEAVKLHSGGSWLYVEIDPGFPWPNVEALFDAVRELRAGA